MLNEIKYMKNGKSFFTAFKPLLLLFNLKCFSHKIGINVY